MTSYIFRVTSVCLLSLLATALVGCDDRPANAPTPQPTPPSLRVISLSPAITQIIRDLGAEETLVAVGDNDFAAPPGLPSVGPFGRHSSEAILAAKPTHVLMMPPHTGVPEQLSRLATQEGFRLVAYPYPNNVADIGDCIYYDDSLEVADAGAPLPPGISNVLNRAAAGWVLRERFLDSFGPIAEVCGRATPQGDERPKVLMVIGTDPTVMASGQGTVHDQVLLLFLKAPNCLMFVDIQGTAPVLSREMLLEASPDVVLLLMPRAAPLGPIASDARLAAFRGLDIPAVRDNRFVLINDPLTVLPSSSINRIAVEMAKGIYPHVAAELDEALKAQPVEHLLPDEPSPQSLLPEAGGPVDVVR